MTGGTTMQPTVLNYTETRKNLREVLDSALEGTPVAVVRNAEPPVAMVAVSSFLKTVRPTLPRPMAVHEEDGWYILLPGTPVASDGPDPESALDEFIDALYEYAEDWVERLHLAPNHQGNWGLVQFVSLAGEVGIRAWVTGDHPPSSSENRDH
jgi:hypothetical protein